MTRAAVIKDSVNVLGNRLVTVGMAYPAIIHPYVLSYSTFARSFTDFRCMTPGSLQQQVRDEGYVPQVWGRAGSRGPVPQGKLSKTAAEDAEQEWRTAMMSALRTARRLSDMAVAREIANRPLEPYAWLRTVATADYDKWCNFLQHRTRMTEQYEVRCLAMSVRDAIEKSKPVELGKGEWHIPYGEGTGPDPLDKIKKSVTTLARMSYRTPRRGDWAEASTPDQDERLYLKLQRTADWAHFEHQALCWVPSAYRNDDDEAVPVRMRAKFADGWVQFRKTVSGECFDRFKFGAKPKRAETPGQEERVTWQNFAEELSISLAKAFRTN